ncbi:MAG: sigma 54-interacting transcriptional regulator [Deltaproteobacteria bacterium]|nr:sigma 54-interacting transcriptional regulator [Deltaproteobacteria bacterium]
MQQNIEGGELRAFVLVRHNDQSWIVDLLLDYELTLGSGKEANIVIDDTSIGDQHAAFLWTGREITLRVLNNNDSIFINGEPVTESVIVRPGDEIRVGPATLIVSITVAPIAQGRRSLTHPEFCERLAEELARAKLRGQPTCLVMIKARSGDGSNVASVALNSFRGGDVVGTYAHDEIEFLLPDTPLSIAKAVVKRLLSTSGSSGTAAGLAIAPDDGDSAQRLLRAARDALAVSIREGDVVGRPVQAAPEPSEPSIHSPSTKLVVEDITEAAKQNQPVLLVGEPNSGKRFYARLLHDRSSRSKGPFVMVSCAALVDQAAVIASFGDENGDIAGCSAIKAAGGSLLLDEIGDLPVVGQRRLLALLNRGDIGPIGLISTTHRDLMALSSVGAFIPDLYAKIAVVRIGIPALRMRAESIVPLARNFAAQFTRDSQVKLSIGAVEKMRNYTWPGNVLELRNAIERAVRLADGGEILAEHLPGGATDDGAGRGQLRRHVGSVERDAIIKTLADNNYNQTHTAKQLGISRRALIYKMEKYGLKPPPSSSRKE